MEVSGKLAERVYAQKSDGDAGASHESAGSSEQAAHATADDVVDAEFEEVKDEKK
jgi:molecular chaperone DnaK